MAKRSMKKSKPRRPAVRRPVIGVASPRERAVLVTTEHRGVFFGYATDTSGTTIKLRAGRNCIYWSSALKGFMGLAATGPDKTSRVGPAVNIEVRAITSVSEVSEIACIAWEAAPWA